MTTTDNWRHRHSTMQCSTCMWFVLKPGGADTVGRCRRKSPTLGGYPVVFKSDWCGEHKLDEQSTALTNYVAAWEPEEPLLEPYPSPAHNEVAPPPKKKRRKLSAAGRAAIAAAAKKRWAKHRKANKK